MATEPKVELLPNTVINNKYILISRLGQGSFGEVFQAILKDNPQVKVAIKFQYINHRPVVLDSEIPVFKCVQSLYLQ